VSIVRDVTSFDAWQEAARGLLREGVPPSDIVWESGTDTLLPGLVPEPAAPERAPVARAVMVPRRFVARARWVAAHRDPSRWDVMYRVLWRTVHENRRLLDDETDADVARFEGMLAQVRRDEHKMHAFVRFRRVEAPDDERYVAWYRPDHHVAPLAAAFFAERYGEMRWSILTPDVSVHWDGREVRFSPGVPRSEAPSDDQLEELWRAYYAATFNPARLNVRAMKAELPVRHWPTLPEARLIPSLVSGASAAVRSFTPAGGGTAAGYLPADRSIASLREAARACQGCPLFERATQTVFGEGPPGARIVLVGEQPGDEEDRGGRPFIGPAGAVLDRALAAAGIGRGDVYLTNAVKHFSWEPRGKRRIHQTPRLSEIRACRPWLEAELAALQPEVLVALGSTAGRSLFGPQFRVTSERGQVRSTAWSPRTVATLHPSAVLRAGTPAAAEQYFAWIVGDLRLAAGELQEKSSRAR
jgi:DNA polymerase